MEIIAEDNPFMHDGIDSNFELEVCKEVSHGLVHSGCVFPLRHQEARFD